MHLLERDADLRILTVALRDVVTGSGRVALVSGEAGIGKTTLIRHFSATRQPDIRLLWGACDALFPPPPFGPLYDMAQQVGGDLPTVLATQANRSQTFAAMLSELQRQVTLAVFEDVHWADEATLDLLTFLSRRITHTRTLLVLSYRDDELDLQHPLRFLLGDLAGRSVIYRVAVAPLSVQGVRQLVGARALDADTLHHQTGGNPFFVTEVLASSTGGLPATIRDAVLARIARLTPAARALLQAAAVVGPRIEPWLLDAVAGTAIQAADACFSSGMLIVDGEMLSFRHELARQTVLDSIAPAHKVQLHRSTLDNLQASPLARTDLTRMAYHAAAANDHLAVLEYAPAAARDAAEAGAHRAAVVLYALALRFSDSRSATDQAALLEAHAGECLLIDDSRAAAASRHQAVGLWRAAGNRLKEGENLAQLAIALLLSERGQEAEQTCRAAIQLLEALPPGRELALAYRAGALLRHFDHDYPQAIALAEKAVALADCYGDKQVLTMAYDILGSTWLFVDYAQGCRILEQGLTIAQAAGLDERVATIYGNLGSTSCRLYRFLQAERYLAAGQDFIGQRDLERSRLHMRAWQAVTCLYLGRWQAAEAAAGEVLAQSGASANSRFVALIALGRLYTRQGAAAATEILDQALDLASQFNYFQYAGAARSARAEHAWLRNDCQRLLAESETLYDLALSKRHPWFAGELAFWQWRAGATPRVPEWIAAPFALQISGNWRAAAQAWEQLACPYEQARALADGDRDAQLQALAIFEQLGAWPSADQLRGALRASSDLLIPPKARQSTRENPYRLTNRELSILGLLSEQLTNTAIAARLSISPKTVDHHVSAILAKLQVPSRAAAVALAHQQQLLGKQRD